MNVESVFRGVRAVATILCALLLAGTVGRLDTGEYAGGALSGNMILLAHIAIVALVPSAVAAAFRPKASLALGVLGAVLTSVAVAYFAWPRLFDVFGGVSSAVLESGPLSAVDFWQIFLLALGVIAVALAEIIWARRTGGLTSAPA